MMFKPRSIEQTQTQGQNMKQQAFREHTLAENNLKSCQNHSKFVDWSIEVANKQEVTTNSQPKHQQRVKKVRAHEYLRSQSFSELKQQLMQRMENLYNQIMSSSPFQNNLNDVVIDQSSEIELVQQFISNIFSQKGSSQSQQLLLIIEHNPCIKEFLQWIYDAAPIFFYKDIIIATCRLTLAYFSLKTSHPSQNLLHLSQNTTFLDHVFNDQSLKLFKISSYAVGMNQLILYAPHNLLSFISHFAFKYLEMLEANCCQYQSLNMSKGRQMSSTEKRSKRIKKFRRRLQKKKNI